MGVLTSINFADIITFTRGSEGRFFDKNGLVQFAGNNVARFDTSPADGSALGLLVEGASVNWLPYTIPDSSTPTSWTSFDSGNTALTTLLNNFAGLSFDVDISDVSHDRPFLQNIYTTTNTTTYTLSAYISDVTGLPGDTVILAQYGDNGNYTATIDDADANGRVSLTWTSVGTAADIRYGPGTAGVPGADGTIKIGGVQLEESSFASTYMPTTTGAAARLIDSALIAAADFPYNTVEGTFFAEWAAMENTTTNARIIGTDAATFLFARSSTATTITQSDGAGFVSVTNGASDVNAGGKAAFSYDATTKQICLDGGNVASAAQVFADPTNFRLGDSVTAINAMFGRIKQFKYWPRAMIAAELQELTA